MSVNVSDIEEELELRSPTTRTIAMPGYLKWILQQVFVRVSVHKVE